MSGAGSAFLIAMAVIAWAGVVLTISSQYGLGGFLVMWGLCLLACVPLWIKELGK